jgi:hypothetical protein
MQVDREQAVDRCDADARIVERLGKGAEDVADREALGLQHHDDRAGGSLQRGLQGISGAEGLNCPDDLGGRRRDRDGAIDHGQDLGSGRAMCLERVQAGVGRSRIAGGDDHHRDLRGVRLGEARGHRLDRAVERLAFFDHVRGSGRMERERGAVVDDTPASRLDASLELIGAGPLAGGTCRGAILGKGDDLGGCR